MPSAIRTGTTPHIPTSTAHGVLRHLSGLSIMFLSLRVQTPEEGFQMRVFFYFLFLYFSFSKPPVFYIAPAKKIKIHFKTRP